MVWRSLFLITCVNVSLSVAQAEPQAILSAGRQADPTAKTLSELRAAEKRRMPLEVQLKTSNSYEAGGPVNVTVILTNLFDKPLVMNSRMLVNHPLLQGELCIQIVDAQGQKVNIQRLITPLSLRDQDFVTLSRGESIQRSLDLANLYGVSKKGVYKIRALYHNDVDFVNNVQHVWKGVVWSDPVEIELN